MAARSFNLTMTGVARRLSDVYAVDLNSSPQAFAAADIPYRQLILVADTTDIEVGAANTVSATVYGFKCFVQTNATPPLVLGPFSTGPIKLSDLWAFAASGTLHILGVPY